MNLDLSQDQQMMRDGFSRLLNEHSSMGRVRSATSGFDRALWVLLAEFGALATRVPAALGGLDLSLLDATVLMEEAGRTLVSGPLAEAIVAARLLALVKHAGHSDIFSKIQSGEVVLSLAFHDVAEQPTQWVAGGAVADKILARKANSIVLLSMPAERRCGEPSLASTPIAQLRLDTAEAVEVIAGPEALTTFSQAIEEWKLLIAAALNGLSREAVQLAAKYACEREAFGAPIGSYQGLSHPLADLITEIDAGRYLTWKVIYDIAGQRGSSADVSLTAWWNIDVASRAVAQALQTFGGYGLTIENDIHLFNLRAKAWPLIFGDPQRLLEEAGRRLYAGETASLPDAGEVSIDFDLGKDARTLAADVDAFFEKTLTPELKAKAHYSWEGHDAEVHKKLAEARLLLPHWPEEFGGRSASHYAASAARQIWEDHGWTTHAVRTIEIVGEIIRRFGSDDIKSDVLAKIVSGDVICSLGFSEPGSGSDVFAAQTRATRECDGWRIDGQKMFTSGANLADYVLMLTRTNNDAPKHKGLTLFLVPLKSPGVTIRPVHTFQDEQTNITFYDAVRIPDSYRLGEVNGGVKVMSVGLELEQGEGFSSVQAQMVRAAEAFSREIIRYGRPLIEDNCAQSRLARAKAHVMLSQVLEWRALWAAAEKKPNLGYGPMAKMFSSETFLSDATDLLELAAPESLSKRVGPAGFLNQCYRRAHVTRIYGGTSEVHRSIIAERSLGLPRSRT